MEKEKAVTLATIGRLEEGLHGIDALKMMTDAFILGNEPYNEDNAANAIGYILQLARDNIAAATETLKAAIKAENRQKEGV